MTQPDEYDWLDHATTSRARTVERCFILAALIVVIGAVVQGVR